MVEREKGMRREEERLFRRAASSAEAGMGF